MRLKREGDFIALQVWLPLTTDELINQGLSDVAPTNRGSTVSTTGKLGKCRHFSGDAQAIDTGYKESFGTGDFSIAAWFKLTKDTNKAYQPIITNKTIAAASVGCGIYFNKSQMRFLWSTADGSNATEIWMSTILTEAFIYDTWHHIVMVRNSSDPKIGYFYIDGVRYDLNSVPAIRNVTNTSTGFCIGSMPSDYSIYRWTGDLNDVRIYDHALSAREVKEIAKGLVCHYTLSNTGNNLYTGSKTFSGTWVNSAYWSTDTETYNGFTVKYKNTVWGGLAQNIPCTNGDIFTISFYAKVQSGGKIISIHRSSLGNVMTGLTLLGGNFSPTQYEWVTSTDDGTEWGRYWATVRIDSADITYLQWRIENFIADKTLYVCGMKLERGSTPTPWSPNSADAEYSSIGLNDAIEYDVSGYKHNGTKSGSLTYVADTPKYWTSTHISATNQKIHISNFPTSGFSNSYTFAWWGKRNSNSPMFWGFSDGVRLNGMYTGYLWNTGDSANNPLYYIGTTTQVTPPSLNVWHHYVMVGNGTKCYVYLDGELWAEAKTYKSISGTSIYINGWDASTAYCSDNTSISDFRIYATALSADDIKELYDTPISLASNGTLMVGGELTEA